MKVDYTQNEDKNVTEQIESTTDSQEYSILAGNQKYTRSNNFITAKTPATLLENKLTAWALKTAQLDSDGRPCVSMTTNDIRNLTGVGGNGIYDLLKKSASNMIGRSMYIEDVDSDGNKAFRFINLIHYAEFRNGIFTVNFTPECTHMLYNLKRDFTTVDLEILFRLKSNDSYRLYEILSTKKYLIKSDNEPIVINYPLSILKVDLNCIDIEEKKVKEELMKKSPDFDKILEVSTRHKFPRWSDFRAHVLQKAVDEINEKTDLFCDYEPVKKGRGGRVQAVRFFVQRNVGQTKLTEFFSDAESREVPISQTTEEMERSQLVDDVRELMKEANISQKDALSLLKAADHDLVKIKKAYHHAQKQGHIMNLIGWMISAIKEDYDEAIEVMEGSRARAEQIREFQKEYEEQKSSIAEKAWKKILSSENYYAFERYLEEQEGLTIEILESLFSPAECVGMYTNWNTNRKS